MSGNLRDQAFEATHPEFDLTRSSLTSDVFWGSRGSYSLNDIQSSAFSITSEMLTGKVSRFFFMPSKA